MIYFDARLSSTYPTVEVRIADVCLRVDDAVLLAALSRCLVETAAREWRDNAAPPQVRTELLRVATWRASRSALTAELVHPQTLRPAPAAAVVDDLVGHIGPALEDCADRANVGELTTAVLARGNGATAQRAAYSRRGRMDDVLAEGIRATLAP